MAPLKPELVNLMEILVGRMPTKEAGQIVVNSQGKWQRTDEMTVLGNIQPDLLED
jgi:hypothetical protein